MLLNFVPVMQGALQGSRIKAQARGARGGLARPGYPSLIQQQPRPHFHINTLVSRAAQTWEDEKSDFLGFTIYGFITLKACSTRQHEIICFGIQVIPRCQTSVVKGERWGGFNET